MKDGWSIGCYIILEKRGGEEEQEEEKSLERDPRSNCFMPLPWKQMDFMGGRPMLM